MKVFRKIISHSILSSLVVLLPINCLDKFKLFTMFPVISPVVAPVMSPVVSLAVSHVGSPVTSPVASHVMSPVASPETSQETLATRYTWIGSKRHIP